MSRALASIVVLISTSLLFAQEGAAHESRTVGKYTVEAGWNAEPALLDRLNAVFFEVEETAGGREVEGLEKTVTVEVTYGGARQTFSPALRAVAGAPGSYIADIIPTRTGDYIFRFTGKIEDLSIDERFESGPGRFASIQAPTDLQFPEPAAGAAEVTAALRDVRDGLARLQLIALAAGALAIAALGVGAFALRRSPRS